MNPLILLNLLLSAPHLILTRQSVSEGCYLNSGSCLNNQTRIHGVCRDPLCRKGYYLKNGKCHRCHPNCKSCVSLDMCTSCTGVRVLHGGKCALKCPRKQYPVQSDKQFEQIRVCAPRKQRGKNCNVGEWSEWGVCGTVGGPHVKTRTRRVGSQAACAGVQPIMYLQCRNLVPVNSACVVSEWFPWEQCDSSCENQFRKRRRIVKDIPGGPRRKRTLCPNLVEEEPCPCFFDSQFNEISPCEFGEWSKWSNCNTPCGPGTQGRLKIPTHHHKMNGCKPIVESRPCCQMTCPDYCSSTLLGEWTDWGKCEGSCERSTRRRVRSNIFDTVLMFCELSELYQEDSCRKRNCKERCHVSEWGEWSDCQNGSRSRRRERQQAHRVFVSNCPELTDSIPCS